jgi:hypothetical protein
MGRDTGAAGTSLALAQKLTASFLWVLGIGGLDFAYIWSHGVDTTAIAAGIFALLPTWAFIARDVELSFFGQKVHIRDVASAAAEVLASAPKALEQARKLPKPTDAELSTATVGELKKELDPARISATGVLHALRTRSIEIDPNVALAYLGKEIEARVSTIADLVGVPQYSSPFQMVKAVQAKGVFPPEFADGLERLMRIGYAAAGGATIVSDRPLPPSYEVLAALDTIVDQLSKPR